VFALGALFSGVLSDIFSRRAILARSLALWSAFTAMGAVAGSYIPLFVTRSFVGVGQSSFLPAAQALLADYFPSRGRAQAMGICLRGILISEGVHIDGLASLRDPDGLARSRYDGREGTVYLIRPDQHVAARWRSMESKSVLAAISRAAEIHGASLVRAGK